MLNINTELNCNINNEFDNVTPAPHCVNIKFWPNFDTVDTVDDMFLGMCTTMWRSLYQTNPEIAQCLTCTELNHKDGFFQPIYMKGFDIIVNSEYFENNVMYGLTLTAFYQLDDNVILAALKSDFASASISRFGDNTIQYVQVNWSSDTLRLWPEKIPNNLQGNEINHKLFKLSKECQEECMTPKQYEEPCDNDYECDSGACGLHGPVMGDRNYFANGKFYKGYCCATFLKHGTNPGRCALQKENAGCFVSSDCDESQNLFCEEESKRKSYWDSKPEMKWFADSLKNYQFCRKKFSTGYPCGFNFNGNDYWRCESNACREYAQGDHRCCAPGTHGSVWHFCKIYHLQHTTTMKIPPQIIR